MDQGFMTKKTICHQIVNSRCIPTHARVIVKHNGFKRVWAITIKHRSSEAAPAHATIIAVSKVNRGVDAEIERMMRLL